MPRVTLVLPLKEQSTKDGNGSFDPEFERKVEGHSMKLHETTHSGEICAICDEPGVVAMFVCEGKLLSH